MTLPGELLVISLWQWLFIHNLCMYLISGEHYLGMWKNDKFHGLGILLVGTEVSFSGIFRDGEKVESRSDDQFQHDDKWAALFQGCAEQLQQMVYMNSLSIGDMHACWTCNAIYVSITYMQRV